MGLFREYFNFTRSERNGIIVFLFIIILLIAAIHVLPYFYRKEKIDYSQFEAEIDKFIASLKADSVEKYSGEINTKIPVYSFFDPNTVSDSILEKMCIPKKTIRSWLNYSSKGGRFRAKEDVKKIYGLSQADYERIYPWISIAEKNNKTDTTRKYNKTVTNNQVVVIEINSADSVQLTTIKGIGPVFAKRIISYRERLGGFVYKEQLLEVYGFTEELFRKIEENVSLNTDNIRRINVNKADFKQMIKHPYFTKDIINRILEYRKIMTEIKDFHDLVKNKLLTEEQYLKIVDYVEI